MAETKADPILADVISDILDRRRASEGIRACATRMNDFGSQLEMRLAGIAMVPEARDLMTERLTEYWNNRRLASSIIFTQGEGREIVVGAGLSAAIFCAGRVRRGFRKPIVLERDDTPGGAFAVSMSPVFRLNSRNRPGAVGLPDQDKALNYIPGAPLQPSMVTSEEYPDNADMAWLIRLALAQYADVYPGQDVRDIQARSGNDFTVTTSDAAISCKRVIDARGMGDTIAKSVGDTVLTFPDFMKRMGGMFPLRGMRQVAVIGGGDSAKCAVESLLGVAPGNSSAIGLDYVNRVDWYTGGAIQQSCEEFREGQRGRYIRIGQFLDGNVSNTSTRLKVVSSRGAVTPLPDGVLVNDRAYDMAVLCTGMKIDNLDTAGLGYFSVRADEGDTNSTVLAKSAAPYQVYKVGPAADIPFSDAEVTAGITANSANKVAMFRLTQRTAALAATLPEAQ